MLSAAQMRSMDGMLLHRTQAARKLLSRAQGTGREWSRGMHRATMLHEGPRPQDKRGAHSSSRVTAFYGL